MSNQDLTNMDQQTYNKNGIYAGDNYQKASDYIKNNEFGPVGREFNSPDRRNEFNNNNNDGRHKRQSSSLHGNYNKHDLNVTKEGVYGQVPDLPPRVDRAIKPMGLLTTPNKMANGRSAHERLFGTKANHINNNNNNDNGVNDTSNENGNFIHKASSLERSQNSKSDSLSSYDSYNKQTNQQRSIGPNAHDDLKTTLSKIDPQNINNSPSKYGQNTQPATTTTTTSHHRHGGSKLDLKYGLPQNDLQVDGSPRNSRELEKDNLDHMSPRGSVERDMYRYNRSPAKQNIPKNHIETKTDYGKYR